MKGRELISRTTPIPNDKLIEYYASMIVQAYGISLSKATELADKLIQKLYGHGDDPSIKDDIEINEVIRIIVGRWIRNES